MYHGLVTFGVSVFTSILLLAMVLSSTTVASAANVANAGAATVGSIMATAGYWLFVALLLGMIAAAAGGSQAAKPRRELPAENPESSGIRRVA